MAGKSIMALVLVGLLACGCQEQGDSPPAGEADSRDLGAARAAAYRFCQAWKDSDYDAARERVTERLVDRYGEQRLRDEIAGVGNHSHESFVLEGGKMDSRDRATFHVEFNTSMTGQFGDTTQTLQGSMALVYHEHRWLVDSLPFPVSDVRTN